MKNDSEKGKNEVNSLEKPALTKTKDSSIKAIKYLYDVLKDFDRLLNNKL